MRKQHYIACARKGTKAQL